MDLRVARAVKRMTQVELERISGVSQSRISLIESGYRTPTKGEKTALSAALGCGVEEISWGSASNEQRALAVNSGTE